MALNQQCMPAVAPHRACITWLPIQAELCPAVPAMPAACTTAAGVTAAATAAAVAAAAAAGACRRERPCDQAGSCVRPGQHLLQQGTVSIKRVRRVNLQTSQPVGQRILMLMLLLARLLLLLLLALPRSQQQSIPPRPACPGMQPLPCRRQHSLQGGACFWVTADHCSRTAGHTLCRQCRTPLCW